jgi:hypothetical protein
VGRAPLPKPFTLSCALTESPTPRPSPKNGEGRAAGLTRTLQLVGRPAVAFLTERTPRERGPATIPPRDGRHSRIFPEAVGGGFERTGVKALSGSIVELRRVLGRRGNDGKAADLTL